MIRRRTFLTTAAGGMAMPLLMARRPAAATPRVRRDVMELSEEDPFFAQYADAVRKMHALPEGDRRNWRRQAQIHADFCKHGSLAFLHWHRHYLAFFEAICGELIGNPDFALPYWNWSKRSGIIPAPFYDRQELDVAYWNDPGTYSSPNWGPVDTVARRGLAKGRGLLQDPTRGGSFTSATLEDIKTMPSASLFRSRLEGSPHNNGHVIVGATASGPSGHIGSGLSPLDPIFWLHHCMVDRLWAEWQKTRSTPDPGETYADDFVDRKGAPAPVAAAQAQTIEALGYTYDILQAAPLVAAAGGRLIDAIVPDIRKVLAQQVTPTTLGSAENDEVSVPLAATAIKVDAPDLPRSLAGDRPVTTFSLGRETIGVEGRRILARLDDVSLGAGGTDFVANVFVDCPYLSPETGYVDPHYAGTFSFFGRGHHGNQFTIDVTGPARKLANEGRLRSDGLTLQLMTLPAYMDSKTDASFKVGRVTVLAV